MPAQRPRRCTPAANSADLVEPNWDENPVWPGCRESLVALVRLLAREAAREVFDRARSADAVADPKAPDR